MESAVLRDLVDDGRGSLTYQGGRYILVRPETLVAFQKAVEGELGARTAELMARGGRTGGALSVRRYRESFGLDARGIAGFMVGMGRQIGWGNFSLERLDLDARALVISVARSPFAEAYGPAPRPVCHLITGVVGGLAEGLFGEGVEVAETTCLAAGGPTCRFEARARTNAGG
jgi:predicted hydrocarbon binding protein